MTAWSAKGVSLVIETHQYIYGGQNQDEYWGGIPVVLLFGDDCQLPPICAKDTIDAFEK